MVIKIIPLTKYQCNDYSHTNDIYDNGSNANGIINHNNDDNPIYSNQEEGNQNLNNFNTETAIY